MSAWQYFHSNSHLERTLSTRQRSAFSLLEYCRIPTDFRTARASYVSGCPLRCKDTCVTFLAITTPIKYHSRNIFHRRIEQRHHTRLRLKCIQKKCKHLDIRLHYESDTCCRSLSTFCNRSESSNEIIEINQKCVQYINNKLLWYCTVFDQNAGKVNNLRCAVANRESTTTRSLTHLIGSSPRIDRRDTGEVSNQAVLSLVCPTFGIIEGAED
jgi:hypothetical protein